MKFRNDFVTNSSSSSYIIATKEEPPKDYLGNVHELTLDYIKKVFEEEVEWSSVSYLYEDKEMQELLKLTDEQMFYMKLLSEDRLNNYLTQLEINKKYKDKEEKVYNIYEDRDWLYGQPSLVKFIRNSNVLESETDL